MWYFSWILGTGFALAFAVLNAMWYEITDRPEQDDADHPAAGGAAAGGTDVRSPAHRDTPPGLG